MTVYHKPFTGLLKWAPLAMVLLTLMACTPDTVEPDTQEEIKFGKNRFTIQVDGYEREYYVHVPSGYKPDSNLPMVIMCHGTSGDGLKFYNISGWKEVGEIENILTVFPSSGRYCIIDDGKVKNTTKWTIFPTPGWTYCQGEVPMDDIKFMRVMIEEMIHRYQIDEKRVYLAGFSNGGAFASRCAIELSDKLAAVVANAGFLPTDTTFSPNRILPVIAQLGNQDHHYTEPAGIESFPMDMDSLLSEYPSFQYRINSYLSSFSIDPLYTEGGDPDDYIWADYQGDISNPDHRFRFVLVKDLKHNYPNGKNHPMMGAEVHWQWISQFRKP